MSVFKLVLLIPLLLSGIEGCFGSKVAGNHETHRGREHRAVSRKHRETNDGVLRFEPEPYSRKLEMGSSGKIHCKVAGGVAPTVQWYLNGRDALPEGVTSVNGTLLVTNASHPHSGQYTCRATDGDRSIESNITLDIVVSPQIVQPEVNAHVRAQVGAEVWLHCVARGDPPPTTHWDRNLTALHKLLKDSVAEEDSVNASTARFVVMNNGTLYIRAAREADSDRYGCTAGSAAGLARRELRLQVHAEGDFAPQEPSGVAGKAVVISTLVAGAYMLLVLALMLYCRRRRLRRRQRGDKMEMEMGEGRDKLVEEADGDKPKANGAPAHNGRLLPLDRDSGASRPLHLLTCGADNSEVSAISRVSKKSGQFEHLAMPRSYLTEQITLGRGEFGDVLLAKVDMVQLRKLRNKEEPDGEPKLRPVLVKTLTTQDETQLCEFRRQLDMFGRVRHESVARLLALCGEGEPPCMVLEHTDWGDLKNFLIATRTAAEAAEYASRAGPGAPAPAAPAAPAGRAPPPPLGAHHRALLAAQLGAAAGRLASKRLTHRDIATRNCIITSKLHLKLSYPALTRGPNSHEYYKLHDQVIPLRWLPLEAVMEGDYSAKSDVYMFAATVWEIYTKAELPFCKLNDNSVLERLKAGTLEWTVPDSMPERTAALLRRCWSNSPTDRPQFDAVYEEMTAVLQDVTSESTSRHSQDVFQEEDA